MEISEALAKKLEIFKKNTELPMKCGAGAETAHALHRRGGP